MSFLVTVRRRGVLVVAAFLAADAGLAVAACSTTSPDADGADAAAVSEGGPDAPKDASVATPDGGRADGGGNCSPAKGKCDIVLQDCPAKQECVVDSSGAAVCRPVQSSQQLPLGRACCPNGANPCLPGLTCVGSACSDGGLPTGRCSPACCKGADQACGKSDPEGISGACDLTIVDPDTRAPLYDVCTYRRLCKPFKVDPCGAGETCLVEDEVGTSSCVTSAGKPNRQPCSFANECADGYACLGAGDASTCHMVCLLPGSVHPFDAGVEQGGPGKGGCPVNEKCNIPVTGRPGWFAVCSLDGG